MKRQTRLVWQLPLILIFLIPIAHGGASASGDTLHTQQSDTPEYSPAVMLTEEDLPGFHQTEEPGVAGHLALAERLTAGLTSPQTHFANAAYFSADDPFRSEFVISFLAYALSEADETRFDALASEPQAILEVLAEIAYPSGSEPHRLPLSDGLADSALGFNLPIGEDPLAYDIDFVWARRGAILQSTWVIYPNGESPSFNVIDLASMVDNRVQEMFLGTTFRPASLYVPDLTTHIPTPLDVSTNPSVIGTNLLLAALMMLPLAAAAEIITSLLGERESSLLSRIPLLDRLTNGRKRAPGAKRRSPLIRLLRICVIIIFYGLIFSLLDRTWQPFTITGLLLFISMMLAYGIVGLADDFLQWRALQKWGTPSELSLRPTNVLLAIGSVLTSRLISLVPGMMFGTPEALAVDEDRLNDKNRNKLLSISAYSLLSIGCGLWILTGFTTLLQRILLPEWAASVLSGLESLLLLIFAVTLENGFVKMLGFSGSIGEALRKKRPWLWLLGLTGVTFLFYHTLINPRGDLASALQESNVMLMLGVAGAFVGFAFTWWIVVRIKDRKGPTDVNGPKKRAPTWVRLISIAAGLMLIGTIAVIRLGGLQDQSADIATLADSAVPPSSSESSTPEVDDDVAFAYAARSLPERLCYFPVESVADNIIDSVIWRGVQMTATQFGTSTVLADSQAQDDEGYGQAMAQLIQRDCGLIIGYDLLRETFLRAAAENPSQEFMLLASFDWQSNSPNLWVTEYQLGQGTYLAGYLASALSDSSKVGTLTVDYPTLQTFQDCFLLGTYEYSQAHMASVSVLARDNPAQQGFNANGFLSPEQGSMLSEELIEQGADVLLPLAGLGIGSTGYEAGLSAQRHTGVSLIGLDVDWAWEMPELASVVMTSVETRFEQSIAIAVQALADGSFSGREHPGTLSSGEIRLSPLRGFANRVSPDLVGELSRLALQDVTSCELPEALDAGAAQPTSTLAPSPSPTEIPSPTPTATLVPEHQINLSGLQDAGISQIEYPAGQPFYIQHGWIFDPGEQLPESAVFMLQVDGVRLQPDDVLIQPYEGGRTAMISYFNFPEGMTGTHTFVGIWNHPDLTHRETLTILFVP